MGRRDTDALEESWGSPEEDEATEEAGVCAGDMVGRSIFLSQSFCLSVSKFLLPCSFPTSLLLHKMSASDKVLGKPRAAGRK